MDAKPPDADLVALAEDLRQVVGGFVRKVRKAADTQPAAWSDTLGALDRRGPMTVAALARLRQVRHQSMRVVVARLEADGTVVRALDATDGRGQVVEVTERGRAALASSRGTYKLDRDRAAQACNRARTPGGRDRSRRAAAPDRCPRLIGSSGRP